LFTNNQTPKHQEDKQGIFIRFDKDKDKIAVARNHEYKKYRLNSVQSSLMSDPLWVTLYVLCAVFKQKHCKDCRLLTLNYKMALRVL